MHGAEPLRSEELHARHLAIRQHRQIVLAVVANLDGIALAVVTVGNELNGDGHQPPIAVRIFGERRSAHADPSQLLQARPWCGWE